MSILFTTQSAFERVKHYLTRNQYLFTWVEHDSQWIITIKY